MKKEFRLFIRDSAWYSLKPVFAKLFNFILIPVYTAYLTPEEYGILQYIIAFGMLFRAVVNLGLDSSFWKFKGESSGYRKEEVTLNFILFQLFAGVTVLMITLLVQVFLFRGSPMVLLIIVFLLAQTIKIIFDSVQILQRANHRSKLYIVGIITQSVVLFVLNILFVVVLKMNYAGVIYSYLIGFTAIGLVFGRVILREAGGRINLGLTRAMLKYGIPLMIGNVAAFIITLSDRFFLKAFSTTTELGLYSFGYKFGDLVNAILVNTFFLAWNPIRWDIYEKPDGKEIFAKFNKVLFMAIPFFGLIVMGGAILLSAILTVDREYLQGIRIIYFIGFSYVLYGLYYFNSMGMLFTDRTGRITWIIVISGVVNLALNFALIPSFGMMGAATATIAGYLIMFILSRILGQRYYPIERNSLFEVTQIGLVFLILAGMTLLAGRLTSIYLLAVVTIAVSLVIPAVNLAFRFITRRDLQMVREVVQITGKSRKKNNK